jgi:biotin synthase-like enzyme
MRCEVSVCKASARFAMLCLGTDCDSARYCSWTHNGMEEVNNSMGCEICLVLGNALSATVQQRDRRDFRRLYISCLFSATSYCFLRPRNGGPSISFEFA